MAPNVEGVIVARRDGKVIVRVTLDGQEVRVLCTVGARLRMDRVHCNPGDHVKIEVFPGAHAPVGRVIARTPVEGDRFERPTAAQRAQQRARERDEG